MRKSKKLKPTDVAWVARAIEEDKKATRKKIESKGKKPKVDKRKSKEQIEYNVSRFKKTMIQKDKDRVTTLRNVMLEQGNLSDMSKALKSKGLGAATLLTTMRRLVNDYDAFKDVGWKKTRPCNWEGVLEISKKYKNTKEV